MNIEFPKLEKEHNNMGLNPLDVLTEFCTNFNIAYSGHIIGELSDSVFISNNRKYITYAFSISFTRLRNYSYRLLHIYSLSDIGGYPLKMYVYENDFMLFNDIETPEMLEHKINEILNSERCKKILFTHY